MQCAWIYTYYSALNSAWKLNTWVIPINISFLLKMTWWCLFWHCLLKQWHIILFNPCYRAKITKTPSNCRLTTLPKWRPIDSNSTKRSREQRILHGSIQDHFKAIFGPEGGELSLCTHLCHWRYWGSPHRLVHIPWVKSRMANRATHLALIFMVVPRLNAGLALMAEASALD